MPTLLPAESLNRFWVIHPECAATDFHIFSPKVYRVFRTTSGESFCKHKPIRPRLLRIPLFAWVGGISFSCWSRFKLWLEIVRVEFGHEVLLLFSHRTPSFYRIIVRLLPLSFLRGRFFPKALLL